MNQIKDTYIDSYINAICDLYWGREKKKNGKYDNHKYAKIEIKLVQKKFSLFAISKKVILSLSIYVNFAKIE